MVIFPILVSNADAIVSRYNQEREADGYFKFRKYSYLIGILTVTDFIYESTIYCTLV